MGLMSKVLSLSTTPAGSSLLKRALELRRKVEMSETGGTSTRQRVSVERTSTFSTAVVRDIALDDVKKKPCRMYFRMAA